MKQPDNIHLDIIIDTMHHFEGMNGVKSLEDYQNIMRYLIRECSDRLENSKQLEGE
jgi:hypothetical protein|tara:strand:- start:1331 stop:1498 length:168 start_codon:yes stop_codon:yes gene_type:complete